MRKGIVILMLFGVYLFSGISITMAGVNDAGGDAVEAAQKAAGIGPSATDAPFVDTSTSNGGSTTVTVTEAIPGMVCPPDGDGTGPEGKKFKCTIEPGFGSVMLILKGLIKYATFITALVGVLMLVVSGVQYSISGANGGDTKDAKARITKVISGLVLLFLIGFILNSVAPWVYK